MNLTKPQASNHADVTDHQFKKMLKQGVVVPEPGARGHAKYDSTKVSALAKIRHNPLPEDIDGVIVHLGGHMENGGRPSPFFNLATPQGVRRHQEALNACQQANITLPAGVRFSGYWPISPENADNLTNSRSVLLGDCSSFIFEGGWIAGEVPGVNQAWSPRRVFIIEPFTKAEEALYLGTYREARSGQMWQLTR